MTTATKVKQNPAVELIRQELEGIEDRVMRFDLADAIREGSKHTEKCNDWEDNGKVCALSAALIACQARQ